MAEIKWGACGNVQVQLLRSNRAAAPLMEEVQEEVAKVPDPLLLTRELIFAFCPALSPGLDRSVSLGWVFLHSVFGFSWLFCHGRHGYVMCIQLL